MQTNGYAMVVEFGTCDFCQKDERLLFNGACESCRKDLERSSEQ